MFFALGVFGVCGVGKELHEDEDDGGRGMAELFVILTVFVGRVGERLVDDGVAVLLLADGGDGDPLSALVRLTLKAAL